MGRKQLFQRNALSIYISGIVAYYLATGLMNDHVNILQPYYAQTYGWSATLITMPVTVAGYVAIVMAAVFGVLYHKFSISRILGVSTLILGLSAIGLSAAGDHLALYSISLFLLRLMVLPLSLGIQYLCTNWFVESRGRALGIVTMGGPLCSATLVAILTAATGAFGFTLTYRVMGILVLVIGLLFLLLVKDKPEQLGLYPDGADHPPAEYRQDAGTMGLKELVHSADTYLIVLPLGLLWLCLVGIMAFFVPQMASTGTDAHTVGIDAIMNRKGFAGHYGLERYEMIEAYNLGSQVPNEEFIKKALELHADVLLVSQTVTQKDVHIQNLTNLIELLEAEGLRDKFVVCCGGPRITHELAKELGYDAGFGAGKYADDVASFAVTEMVKRGMK